MADDLVGPFGLRRAPSSLAVTIAQPNFAADAAARADAEAELERASAQTNVTEFGRALNRGTTGLRRSLSAGVDAAQTAVGVTPTPEGPSERANDLSVIQANAPTGPTRVADVHDVAGAGKYVANLAGEQLPALGLYGLSALLGRGVGARYVAAMAPAIARSAPIAGEIAGVALPATLSGAGEVSQAAHERPDVQARLASGDLSEQDLARTSLAAGGVEGALFSLPVVAQLRRMGLGRAAEETIAHPLLERVLRGAGEQGAILGGTAGAASLVQHGALEVLGKHADVMDPAELRQIVESGFGDAKEAALEGALGGGLIGGAGGAIPPRGRLQARVARDNAASEEAGFRQGRGASVSSSVYESQEPGRYDDNVAKSLLSNLKPDSFLNPESASYAPERAAKLQGLLKDYLGGDASREAKRAVEEFLPEHLTPAASRLFEAVKSRVPAEVLPPGHIAPSEVLVHPDQAPTKRKGTDQVIGGDRELVGKGLYQTAELSNLKAGGRIFERNAVDERIDRELAKLHPDEAEQMRGELEQATGLPARQDAVRLRYAGLERAPGGDLFMRQAGGDRAQAEALARAHAEDFFAKPGNERLREQYDPKNPLAFANKFEYLTKAAPERGLDLTNEDLDQLVKPYPKDRKLRPGDIAVERNGKPGRVHVQDLFDRFKNERELSQHSTESGLEDSRAHDVLTHGLASLMTHPEMKVWKPKDSLTLFTRRDGSAITWGDLKNPQARPEAPEAFDKGAFDPGDQVQEMGQGVEHGVLQEPNQPRQILDHGVKDMMKGDPEPPRPENVKYERGPLNYEATPDRGVTPEQAKSLRASKTPKLDETPATATPPADTAQKLGKLHENWRQLLGTKHDLVTDRAEAVRRLGEAHDRLQDTLGGVPAGGETHRQLTRVRDSLQAVMQRVSSGQANGLFHDAGGEAFIYVNPDRPIEKQIATLGHEVGHAVMQQIPHDPELHQSVLDAYHGWLRERGTDIPGSVLSRSNIVDAARYLTDAKHADEMDLRMLQDPKFAQYFRSLPEWFAEQTSRWLTTDARPRGAVEKFFSDIAAKIKQLYTMLLAHAPGVMKRELGPDASISRFYDSLISKQQRLEFARKSTKETLDEYASSTSHLAFESVDPTGAGGAHAASEWYDKLKPEERAVLGRAFTQGTVRTRLLNLVKQDPGTAAAIRSGDVKTAATMGYQLWRAGTLEVGDQVGKLYGAFQDAAFKALGAVRDDERAREIMAEVASGHVLQRTPGAAGLDVSRFRDPVNTAQAGAQNLVKLAGGFGRLFGFMRPAIGQMQGTGNPVLTELANLVQPRTGEESRNVGMIDAKRIAQSRFLVGFDKALNGLSADQLMAAHEVLKGAAMSGDRAVRQAVGAVRAQFREIYDYMKDAGLTLGDQGKDYFPWVFDDDKLTARRSELVAMLDKYDEAKALGGGAEIVERLIRNFGYADDGKPKGRTPFAPMLNSRVLSFVKGDDMSLLSQLMDSNVHSVLARYAGQATRRAEFSRRFGSEGEKLETMIARAREHGATDDHVKLAYNYIDASMGMFGAEMHPALHGMLSTVDKAFGTKWAETDPNKLRQKMGAVIAYENVRTLALATISNLSDAVGIGARGGLDPMITGLREGLRQMVANSKGKTTELEELGRSMGVIESHALTDAINEMYGNARMGKDARKINDWFFRKNGMAYWNKLTRLMGVTAGRRFLAKLADPNNPHADRHLAQLDLERGDLTVTDGMQEVLTDTQRANAAPAEVARDDKIRAALNRFVDESTVRPNATQRALWMSHPDLQLFAYLKQYMYGMQEVVVRRMLTEAKHGNYAPVASLVPFAAVAVAAEALRDELRFGGDGDPQKASWGFNDYVWNGIDRSGALGTASFITDASRDVRRGSAPWSSFEGIPAEHLGRIADSLTFGTPSLTAETIDSLPGETIIKPWLHDLSS